MLANVAEILEGRIQAERVLVRLGNAFSSLGPVCVLALYGEAVPSLADWPVYVLALGAQVAFEFASAAAHERIALGVPRRLLVRYMSQTWGRCGARSGSTRARRDTELVALLHNVGKIRIPNKIINKPRSGR